MKTYKLLALISLLSFSIISCTSSSPENNDGEITVPTVKKAAELTRPSILSPQPDAVCQGTKQSDGKFKIAVESTEHYGVDVYLFQIWDSNGKLIEQIEAKTNKATFSNLEEGYAYTLAVKISNTSYVEQSGKISFCTPGVRVSNYIPTVRSAIYSLEKKTLSLILHDPDTSDEELSYSVIISNTKDFDNQEIIKEDKPASKQTSIVLQNLNFDIGTYVKIIVKDKLGSQSAYIFQV